VAVGIAFWIVCGIVALGIARIVPIRRGTVSGELVTAAITALLAGLVATALDFGGWKEPDWRAGAFVFLVALSALAILRLLPRRPARKG
jgi:hypothetical protein